MPYHVGKAEFGRLVEKALDELPPPFDQYMQEIPVEIRDRPTRRQLRHAGVDSGHLLLGLYEGLPLTDRSIENPGMAGAIYIFQESIESACDSEQELVREVRTTVLHEIGHHFGMSEEDLEELGFG